MESVSLRIVKHLAKSREMNLRDVAMLLPKHTNDHLDYYPVASLISGGYVDMWLETAPPPLRERPVIELAILLYMWVTGGAREFEYRGMHSQGGDFGKEKVFATAKAYFFSDEIRRKRAERIWAFSAAIVTALFATMIRSLF
jgi:hypothetical protein